MQNNSGNTKKASKDDFLRTIARMYYILGLTQQDIAKKLNIGRSSVARFLAEARETGIVNITIADPSRFERHPDLEDRLIAKFRLKDAIVADSGMPNTFCAVAARYLDTIFPYASPVAISGGKTLFSLAPYMRQITPRPDLKVIQACGIFTEAVPSASCVQAWADALRAAPVYLSAPGIVDNPDIRQVLMEDTSFKNTYTALRETDLIVVGVGDVEDVCSRPSGIIDARTDTIRKVCAGEVCFHFYDRSGRFCMPEISGNVIGVTTADYARIPTRVGISRGAAKVEAIAAALRGGVLNILITDHETADAVLAL